MVDNERVAAETKAYQSIPIITNFVDEDGVDRMEEEINANFTQIKSDVQGIVEEELERLGKDKDEN